MNDGFGERWLKVAFIIYLFFKLSTYGKSAGIKNDLHQSSEEKNGTAKTPEKAEHFF